MLQRIAAGMAVLLVASVALLAWAMTPHEHGYFGPVFAPDGQSVYAIERDVRATIFGLGYEFWTPPAKVRIHRDRFRLINIRLADGRLSTVQDFPPSPLEGTTITAYHNAIFGAGRGSLRWADGAHLEYTMSVERSEIPSSRTFVTQRQWDRQAGRFIEKPPWQEGYDATGGSLPEQLFGDLEVIAPTGDELLPCGILVLRKNAPTARVLIDTPVCRKKYGDYSAASLASLSRRADIEHTQEMTRTYKRLVAEGKARGLNEGAAMLEANKRMEDLGYYPKSPTITAHPAECERGATPVFTISDEEFRVGLFQDIERAIQHPGTAEEKGGTYVRHQDYDTSERINAYLSERQDATFYVNGLGGCWQLVVKYYR